MGRIYKYEVYDSHYDTPNYAVGYVEVSYWKYLKGKAVRKTKRK